MIKAPQLRSNASVHLDAIRGAAALVVFLGHGRPLFLSSQLVARSAPKPEAAAVSVGTLPRTTIGHEAVIVFFVLSGYFVGGSVFRSVRRGTFAWKRYLLQRTQPPFGVVLIPALLLGLAVDSWGLHRWGGIAGSLYTSPAGSLVAPNLIARLGFMNLLGNALFLQSSGIQPFGTNVALWSLACEFWYYVFFPLLLSALLTKHSIHYRLSSILLLALLASGLRKGSRHLLSALACGMSRRCAAGEDSRTIAATVSRSSQHAHARNLCVLPSVPHLQLRGRCCDRFRLLDPALGHSAKIRGRP